MRALIATAVMVASILASIPAGAQIIGCDSEASVSCSGMRVSICPRGDFEYIKDGCGNGTDYIEVFIRDMGGTGIAGIPWTDYWMDACDPQYQLGLCVQHFVADSLTDVNGRTTFSGRISAGGCIPDGGIYIAYAGMTLLDPQCIYPICLDVVLVSPDINADSFVNLSDLSFFGESYNKQVGEVGYDTCCDFNDDGWCNLSDFSYIGQHYQHRCF
jgi:hypothetical protein